MQPFASKPDKADFQIQIHPVRIEGWVSWEWDSLFRPTIGIFIDDVLKRLVPTERFQRETTDGKVIEPCRFDIHNIDVAGITATSSLTISCVEKGQILRTIRPSSSARDQAFGMENETGSRKNDRRAPINEQFRRLLRQAVPTEAAAPPDIIDVEAILDAGRKGSRAFGHGGFLRFLSLPLLDQLNILFIDMFDRNIDPGAVSELVRRVTAGETTILDVRDEILGSGEFWSRGPFSPDTPIGAWCTWDGLNDLDPALMPKLDLPNAPLAEAGGEALRSYISLAAQGDTLPRHLARIALGPASSEQAYLTWYRSHYQVVCTFDAALPDESAIGATASSRARNSDPVRRNVLTTVSVGKAGRRVDETIRSEPGRGGHLTFGPYIKLPVGTHRVSMGFSATVESGTSSRSAVSLEVVCGDVLFARHDMRLDASTNGTVELDFTIPKSALKLTQDTGFEFRVEVDGQSAVTIETMALTQNIEDGGATAYPNVPHWLDAMSVGPMASRLGTGEIACPPKVASGFVIFGPYVRLLPGQYTLTVGIICEELGRSGKPLTLEVSEPMGVMVSTQSSLNLGENEMTLPFTVAAAASLSGLRGPLEFRLKSETGFGFRVSRVTVEQGQP